ncbi:MAG: His/Gly/Thr/Pro-type tRNA ligase C-terminal domain-containing protein, partial [Pseudomonadota bacterium]
RVTFDAGIVRGLEYYTGPVWEAELLFETKNEKGQPVRFGSVGSGGRYDGLVKRFKGIEVPATGCSIGVSRLQAALESVASGPAPSPGPCIVLVLDEARRAEALSMVSELRAAGVRSELYLGTAGMKAQLKYADRRASPLAIIEGEDERAAGAVTLKDLDLGARMSAEIADNTEWRQGQPAQTTLPRTDLVSAVKRILADQAKRGTGP